MSIRMISSKRIQCISPAVWNPLFNVGSQLTRQQLQDLNVEAERPSLEAVSSKDELRSLKKDERKRLEVVNELVHTERTHVRELRVMQLLFYQPMLNESSWISSDFVNQLFPGLDDVLRVHVNLKDDLMAHRMERYTAPEVANILVKHFDGDNGELFIAACSKFCQDQSHALDVLRRHTQKEPKFAVFLQEVSAHPLCRRLELKDLLPKVMQRLTKYPLLIDSLLKHTAQNSGEYEQLVKARCAVKHLLERVNEAVREMENRRKACDFNRKLDRRHLSATNDPLLCNFKQLNLSTRKLLLDGRMTWRLGGGKHVDVHVALFSDIIVLMQPQEERLILRSHNVTVTSAGKDKIAHGPVIKLKDLKVQEYAADRRAIFALVLSAKEPKRYELVAPSVLSRTQWLDAMTEAVVAPEIEAVRRNSDNSI